MYATVDRLCMQQICTRVIGSVCNSGTCHACYALAMQLSCFSRMQQTVVYVMHANLLLSRLFFHNVHTRTHTQTHTHTTHTHTHTHTGIGGNDPNSIDSNRLTCILDWPFLCCRRFLGHRSSPLAYIHSNRLCTYQTGLMYIG